MKINTDLNVKFVNVYWVERHYGGREEGGWWYDTGDPEASFLVHASEADAKRDELDAGEYNNQKAGNRELGSVLSTGVYQITIEDKAPEPFPKERPFYE